MLSADSQRVSYMHGCGILIKAIFSLPSRLISDLSSLFSNVIDGSFLTPLWPCDVFSGNIKGVVKITFLFPHW